MTTTWETPEMIEIRARKKKSRAAIGKVGTSLTTAQVRVFNVTSQNNVDVMEGNKPHIEVCLSEDFPYLLVHDADFNIIGYVKFKDGSASLPISCLEWADPIADGYDLEDSPHNQDEDEDD